MRHSRRYEQKSHEQPEETWRLRDLLDLDHPSGRQAFVTFMGSSVLAGAIGISVAASLGTGVAAAIGMDRWESHNRQQAESK